MDQLQLEHERHYLKLKKQMLDYIQKAQQNMNKNNEYNLELNTKFGILYKNQMLNELEHQSNQIKELLSLKAKNEKIIYLLKEELETHKQVEQIIAKKKEEYLELIKKFEKNNLNDKIMELFEFVNDIILGKVEPEELNILINDSDRVNLKNSPILGSVAYVLSNLTGANGRLSINDLVNIFTNDTGFIRLKNLYNKDIHFEFNLTNKNNISLGNLEFYLNDLNYKCFFFYKNYIK